MIKRIAMMVAVAMIGALFLGNGVAQAAPTSTSHAQVSADSSPDPSTVSPEPQVKDVQRKFELSGVQPSTSTRDGLIVKTYRVSGAPTVVTTEPMPGAESTGVVPMFYVHVGWGVYIGLDRTDQGAVATGGAAGLAALVCAIPAVNVFGCAAVVSVLGTAAFYIAANGFCANVLEVQMPFGGPKCV